MRDNLLALIDAYTFINRRNQTKIKKGKAMENLKKETLNEITSSNHTINDISWAKVVRRLPLPNEPIISSLKVNHNEDEMNNFINSLDYNYKKVFDKKHDEQEVYCIIVFNDGTYLKRYNSYTYEEWIFRTKPTTRQIPPSCR